MSNHRPSSTRLRFEPLEARRLLAVVQVNTNADVVDGDTTSITTLQAAPGVDGKISLREALNATNNTPGADEVTFDPSVFTETNNQPDARIDLTLGQLEVTDELAITGLGTNKTVINAQGDSRVLDMGAVSQDFPVTLEKIHVFAGVTKADAERGAGIRKRSDGTLTLLDSLVSANRTEGRDSTGGGIYVNASPLVLIDSTVTTNRTWGIAAHGAGVYGNGQIMLQNSTLSDNFTENEFSKGAAAYARGYLNLTGSTVEANEALADSSEGGALVSFSGITLTESLVQNNIARGADSRGGGVWSLGDVSLTDSSVIGNSTRNRSSGGGGIYALGDVTLLRSTVSGNTTLGSSSRGGGIYGRSAVSLTNSTVSGNSTSGATAPGGGIWAGGAVTLLASTITENAVNDNGGGLYLFGSNAQLQSSIVAANSAAGAGADIGRSAVEVITTTNSLIGDNDDAGLAEAPVGSPDGDGNFIGGPTHGVIDPLLTALAFNGGPTMVHGLMTASPAVDAGANPGALTNDQRGANFPRTLGIATDMGAFELPPPASVSASTIIQAEDVNRRTSGQIITNSHDWFIVDAESPGDGAFSPATGPDGDYLQVLESITQTDTPLANADAPAGVTAEFDVQIDEAGAYYLDLRAAGLSFASGSLWVEILGQSPVDDHGAPTAGDALRIDTDVQGQFAWLTAGEWNLPTGVHTIRVSMRQSGVAIDALRLEKLSTSTRVIDRTRAWQAEDFDRRRGGVGDGRANEFFIVDDETSGLEAFAGATGAEEPRDYLQVLNTSTRNTAFGVNVVAPTGPFVEYDINISTSGEYALDVGAAGLADGARNSYWVEIVGTGASIVNAEGLAASDGALHVETNTRRAFEWLDAGVWDLPSGDYRVRVSMRESGTSIDALRMEPLTLTGPVVIQAEDMDRRADGTSLWDWQMHSWFIVDDETAGDGVFTGATGADNNYIQVLDTATELDTILGRVPAPAGVTVEYDLIITEGGVYDLDINAAGLSPTSDSLWVEIPGGILVDAQQNTAVNRALQINTDVNGQFSWLNAGRWNLPLREYTIRLSMRESGTAVDALRLTSVPDDTPVISGAAEWEAEDFERRSNGSAVGIEHGWFIIDAETAGDGTFTEITGADTDYIQALRTSTESDSPYANASIRGGVTVEYDFVIAESGVYDLDINAAGVSFTSDSVWVDILGQSPVDAQQNETSGNALRVNTDVNGLFSWLPGGHWNLPAGDYTIRLSMRESGAAVDALRLAKLDDAARVISGISQWEAEDFERRNAGPAGGAAHDWFIVDDETAGVGAFTGASGSSSPEDYLQALTSATQSNSFGNNAFAPAGPFVEYDVNIQTAGEYNLDLRAAGLNGNSDSLWVEVVGPSVVLNDAEGRTQTAGALLIPTNSTAAFEWLDAGKWNLQVGDYTIRVYMRESGTALDALRMIEPLPT